MKKFLKNYDFEDHFDSHILSRGKSYCRENRVLDIWYQNNSITAYIEGSEIYRVELKVDDKEMLNYYCSCPYSEDGEFMCKHIASVLYYLQENNIPELEAVTKKQKTQNESKSTLNKIYDEMQYELRKISDRNGFVNYNNGRYVVALISDISNYINEFIDNEEYDNAFELIKYSYQFIKNTYMDGSNGEYQDSLYLIDESASRLLYNDEYFDIFLNYTYYIASNHTLDDFSDSPLHAFILYVHNKVSAEKVIKILDNIESSSYGIFVNPTLDKISLTYEYINKDDAINLCYENIEHYGVEDLLIKYLKNDNKIAEIIRILKDDVKNHVRKNIAYNKLLDIYAEYNMLAERKKILPKVIIETSSFKRYKELKDMCNEDEWKNLKEKIISKIELNNSWILEDIYMEEKETDKLFELLRKNSNMLRLAKYQDAIKDKYSKELCTYIGKMSELNDSDDFIFEMLKEMYPSYKSKRAFKEEIMKVLSNKNKQRFYELI